VALPLPPVPVPVSQEHEPSVPSLAHTWAPVFPFAQLHETLAPGTHELGELELEQATNKEARAATNTTRIGPPPPFISVFIEQHNQGNVAMNVPRTTAVCGVVSFPPDRVQSSDPAIIPP